MIASFQSGDAPTSASLDPRRPRADYYAHQADIDPFPDSFLLHTEDANADEGATHSSISYSNPLPVHSFTIRHQYPMPILEEELTGLAKSIFFANFDFVQSYWQLLLHPDSQASQFFITPDRVFSPTHVPHGTNNAVTPLQSSIMLTLPNALKTHLLLGMDDYLLHCTTIPSYLDCIRHFLEYCAQFNCKLHPAKFVLFYFEARWCGGVISSEGIRHDPSSIDSLLDMDRTKTGCQL